MNGPISASAGGRGGTGAVGTGAVDGAREVRDEDSIDAGAVTKWLRAQAAGLADLADLADLAEPVDVRQFTGGASNLTYLLRYPDRDLILRRPPAGTKARGAHDMRREHDLQAALRPQYAKVPRMIGYCPDESVTGSEFYVMERLVGTILRGDLPPGLDLDPTDVRRLCDNAVDALVELHSVDVAAAGLSGLDRGPGYVGRQVAGWSTRYTKAHTPDVGTFERVMAWLAANQPPDVARVLIHNDFRFDNLVLAPDDPTRIVGVLDWELATVGDPLMDLGSSLAYWVQADDDPTFLALRRQPTHLPGMLTRAQVVLRYADRMGLAVSPAQWTFYEVFGLFRLAGIAQQIYYRFFHGQTTNPTFAQFGAAVNYLQWRCERLIGDPG